MIRMLKDIKSTLVSLLIGISILTQNCNDSQQERYNNGIDYGDIRVSIQGCSEFKNAILYLIKQEDSLSAFIPSDMYSYIDDSHDYLNLLTDTLGRLDADSIPIGYYNIFIRVAPIAQIYDEDSLISSNIIYPCEEIWLVKFRVAKDSVSFLSETLPPTRVNDLTSFPYITKGWKELIREK